MPGPAWRSGYQLAHVRASNLPPTRIAWRKRCDLEVGATPGGRMRDGEPDQHQHSSVRNPRPWPVSQPAPPSRPRLHGSLRALVRGLARSDLESPRWTNPGRTWTWRPTCRADFRLCAASPAALSRTTGRRRPVVAQDRTGMAADRPGPGDHPLQPDAIIATPATCAARQAQSLSGVGQCVAGLPMSSCKIFIQCTNSQLHCHGYANWSYS